MSSPNCRDAPGALLPWDTEFFGFRIGRLESRRLAPATLAAALAWAADQQLRCLYFFADATCPTTLACAHQGGFKFVDVRMEFAAALSAPPGQPNPRLRPATRTDLPALEQLARTAHHDTRFFKDTNFPANRSADLYAEWIRRDHRLHHLIVAPADASGIAGYVTCQIDTAAQTGRIGLIAVTEATRGRGLGRALVGEAMQHFRQNGCRQVVVTTQASNVPAQRLYQALGFRTSETSGTFHRWF